MGHNSVPTAYLPTYLPMVPAKDHSKVVKIEPDNANLTMQSRSIGVERLALSGSILI